MTNIVTKIIDYVPHTAVIAVVILLNLATINNFKARNISLVAHYLLMTEIPRSKSLTIEGNGVHGPKYRKNSIEDNTLQLLSHIKTEFKGVEATLRSELTMRTHN